MSGKNTLGHDSFHLGSESNIFCTAKHQILSMISGYSVFRPGTVPDVSASGPRALQSSHSRAKTASPKAQASRHWLR